MKETAAREILAVRAIETADRARALWTDAERAAATQDAARDVGGAAAVDDFLARRAHLALERLAISHPDLVRALGALSWPRWTTPVLLVAAFVAGVAVDRVGAGARVDILAPPVLGVLAWNLAVYLVLLARTTRRPRAPATGGLRRALATGFARLRGPSLPGASGIVTTFATAWGSRAAPLYLARATRVLHLAAALLALGLIAGLYLRGLALEYRASWQSTFLHAPAVHAIVGTVLAPAAWLTGLAVPSVEHIASIRAGSVPGSENAATWLHLYAATLVLLVVAPRAALAAAAGWVERRRARTLALPLDEPYFRRLLQDFRDGPASLLVVPYSYTLPQRLEEPLRRVLRRAFGEHSRIAFAPRVEYGAEDTLQLDAPRDEHRIAVALFNATATPEAAAHAAFAAALGAHRATMLALVDESSLRARWPGDAARIEARRAAWRAALAPTGARVAFVDIADPDLGTAETALLAALAVE